MSASPANARGSEGRVARRARERGEVADSATPRLKDVSIADAMLRRRMLLIAASLLAAASAFAQDVVQVGGETHKVLLEIAQVRVLAVKIKAGEKVPMHSRPASVSYYVSDGKLRIMLADGKTVEREPNAGAAAWSEPVTHAVENIGTSDFTPVQIELKNAAPAK